jgi:hypothetical protein
MPDTIDYVGAIGSIVAGIAVGGPVNPVGWALTAGGLAVLAKMGADSYSEHKGAEAQKANGVSLIYIPGDMHSANQFVHVRGGMAFQADQSCPWLWREDPKFQPKAWYRCTRATERWPKGSKRQGIWKFEMYYH